jgi:ParB-like chromosome segregation protein Spo0J
MELDLITSEIVNRVNACIKELESFSVDDKIAALNAIKTKMHEISPMREEPVDCVLWIREEGVIANDYNPNSVAPPEMELLRVSISEDGYTQPIVTFKEENGRTVVDGFHRTRVGKECPDVRSRINGYLPVVTINENRGDRSDRMASTIRHNRARGKHKITAMSEIVVELKRRNWSNQKIGTQLGMDPDEILRLSQISGLAEMFADKEFSEAWEVDSINENDSLNVNDENLKSA